jgi:hypothetical protein
LGLANDGLIKMGMFRLGYQKVPRDEDAAVIGEGAETEEDTGGVKEMYNWRCNNRELAEKFRRELQQRKAKS